MFETFVEELLHTDAGVGLLVTYALAGGALLRTLAGAPASALAKRPWRRGGA